MISTEATRHAPGASTIQGRVPGGPGNPTVAVESGGNRADLGGGLLEAPKPNRDVTGTRAKHDGAFRHRYRARNRNATS